MDGCNQRYRAAGAHTAGTGRASGARAADYRGPRGAGKPLPDPYLAGAALLGVPAAECVVFEDSESGVKAGHAAGCTVVATTFSHEAEQLAAAHYLVRDLTGVEVESGADGITLRFRPLV